jgi:hypothetical protein
MKRTEKLQDLDIIVGHIGTYERRINEVMPNYYNVFSTQFKWQRQCEINKKCLAFWKRRFNRILLTLGYNL